ncbi:MAG: AAA family ATPase [Bdellovibrionota bacterium]
MKRISLGLTGTNASGKGTVADYLISKGFDYISLSDELRQEAIDRKLQTSRENLTQLGKELRLVHGPGFLAKRLVQKVNPEGWTIIDSIRHPKEVEVLRSLPHFVLLGIDADIQLRYERAVLRGRDESAKTLEEFERREQEENQNQENSQQLSNTLRLADCIVQNNDSQEALIQAVNTYLKSVGVLIS